MVFWKSIAIALAVVLGISYAGFAYVYSQSGGITIIGMDAGGVQPKVVTLLRNANITLQGWNISADVQGYKTGFLYWNISSWYPWGQPTLMCQFEVDGILAGSNELNERLYDLGSGSQEINIRGTRMWVEFYPDWYGHPQSAVVSISLYLRD